MSTIAETVAALQILHAGINGVASAPTAMPSNLDQIDLPIALVWPGEATWTLHAIGLHHQDRTYIVRVFVAPVAQGVAGPDEGYQECMTLMEAFGQAYIDDPTLGDVVDHIEDRGSHRGHCRQRRLGWRHGIGLGQYSILGICVSHTDSGKDRGIGE